MLKSSVVFSINRVYGFFDDCNRRFSVRLWRTFQSVFDYMPLAALINGRILCMHGGISPNITKIGQIKDIQRPLGYEAFMTSGIPCDLLWADPDYENKGWTPSARGISNNFGADVVEGFCKKLKIDIIVRAHQVVQDGFQFFANKQLVTIFSAPNYCNEFDNRSAVMMVKENMECIFKTLKSTSQPAPSAHPVSHGIGHASTDPTDPSTPLISTSSLS
ncbi:MAG: hypothetical protein GY696_32595 [Gammaproteobacteria bacterium]|nr:hypothetical protein [Gammaproteobacteria bacterium]